MSRIRALAREHPRCGCRRIRASLQRDGRSVDLERVRRPRRREGLKVPQVRRKRRRLGQSESGCSRRRSERPDHVRSYDFIHDRAAEGRGPEMLPVVDEFAREWLAIEVERGPRAEDVVSTAEYLFEVRGEPGFIAEAVRGWLAGRGAKTLYIAPGSPRGDAYSETSNTRLRDELLDREVFPTLKQAKLILEDHRLACNPRRPHSSLGYRTPAELAAARVKPGVASLPPRPTPYRCSIPHSDSPWTRIRGQVRGFCTSLPGAITIGGGGRRAAGPPGRIPLSSRPKAIRGSTGRLVVDAPEMALARRMPGEGLVARSDRGSRYAGEHYQGLLAGHEITRSLSRRANCWDHAPMGSLFASPKRELTRGETFATRE